MKGDFSRRTFDATKHYSAVLVEQGRVITDADSEEEHRILAHRRERGVADVIGPSGGPLPDAGFGLTTVGTELQIGEGPYYVGGTLLENEADVTLTAQPDRYDVPWPPPAGRHAIVVEHWPRLVTALDDPSIREVALGGPTTSSRERVVWQVSALPVAATWVCSDPLPDAEVTTGTMAARAEPDALVPTPCLIPPQAGYTGLENQFYRVEVFDSGDAYDLVAAPDTVAVTGFPAGQPNAMVVAAVGTLAVGDAVEVYRTGLGADPVESAFAHVTGVDAPTSTLTLSVALPAFGPTDAPHLRRVGASFVVSRDNGSVVTGIEAIEGDEVTVHDLGPDDVLGFAVGQLVELSDDRVELEGLPRQLRQVADIDTVRRVVVLRTPPDPLDAGATGVDPARHPKLRRWDAVGGVRFLPDGTGWIHLENGNQVRFLAGHYRSGDSWTFPARAATVDAASGTIAWPDDGGAPALLPPQGIERQRAVLGRVDVAADGTLTDLVDCRRLFPPLTALRTLLYVGGDGQEGSPGDASGGFIPLAARLAVRVANGGLPVAGAQVRFVIGSGAGRLEGGPGGASVDATTDANGLASVQWDIGTADEHQTCVALLLSAAGIPIAHQVVRFHATIDADTGGRRGCCWSVGPEGDYSTIGEAVADLLERGVRDLCLCLMSGDHEFEGGPMEWPDKGGNAHLSIHGCGRGTRVRVKEPWVLTGWATFRLRDVDLYLGEESRVALDGVADVELSGCHVFGLVPEGSLVGVQGFSRLSVTGCLLVARRREGFEVLRRLFDGLGPLEQVWKQDDELELRRALAETATELVGLDRNDRTRLIRDLRVRVQRAPGDVWSRGEIEAATRLAGAVQAAAGVADIAAAVNALGRSATVARGGVALEVGPAPSGELGEPAPRVSVLLGDSIVLGTVAFYGHGDLNATVDQETLKLLDAFVTDKVQVRGSGGDVHVRDNRLGRLRLGVEMLKALDALVNQPSPLRWAYGTFHLVDNVIDDVVSEVLASHLVLTGNDFTLDCLPPAVLPPGGRVAHVIGDSAVYTANHGELLPTGAAVSIFDATRTRAAGVNLDVQVV